MRKLYHNIVNSVILMIIFIFFIRGQLRSLGSFLVGTAQFLQFGGPVLVLTILVVLAKRQAAIKIYQFSILLIFILSMIIYMGVRYTGEPSRWDGLAFLLLIFICGYSVLIISIVVERIHKFRGNRH